MSHRADDVGVRRDELHAVAGGQDEAGGLLGRRARTIRRLRREVGRVTRRGASPAAAESRRAYRRAGGLLRARAGHLVLAVHDRHVGAQPLAFWRQRQDRRERRAHGLGHVLEHQPVADERDVGDVHRRLSVGADRRRHLAAVGLHGDRKGRFVRHEGERHEPVAHERCDLRRSGWRRRALPLERGCGAFQQGDRKRCDNDGYEGNEQHGTWSHLVEGSDSQLDSRPPDTLSCPAGFRAVFSVRSVRLQAGYSRSS